MTEHADHIQKHEPAPPVMRELIRARDDSHEASIRLALDVAGVDTSAIENRFHSVGPIPGGTTFFVHERDYERARKAVADLAQTSPSDEPERPVFRKLRWIIAAMIAAYVILTLWRGGAA